MIVLYTVYNAVCVFLGEKIYKKLINPILLYCVVWQIALFIHEANLINYYNLTVFAWLTIFIMQSIYVIGCYIGYNVAGKVTLKNNQLTVDIYNEKCKRQIKLFILICILIASVGIIGNVVIYMRHYGFNLFSKLNIIYYERVNNLVSITTIPYISSFIYVVFALLGIYLKKYGFTFLIIPAVPLIVMMGLISGARADMVFSLLFIVVPYLITENKRDKSVSAKQNLKMILPLAITIILLLIIILIFTSKRGGPIDYATPFFKMIFGENVAIYKIFVYISSPIGTLSEYLKTCEFNFGQNTFLPIYNLLSNFGIIDRVNQYQEFFYTPVACNVGTWYRELIEDFTYGGALFAVLFFSFIMSYAFTMSKNNGDIKYKLAYACFGCVTILSFFDWRFRCATIWIPLFFSYLIGLIIEKKLKKTQ